VETVSIALILSVDVNEHGEAFGDVALGGQVDAERLWRVGDRDEGLDDAIAVDCTVFFELEACFGPFNLAYYLPEARHLGDSARDQCVLLDCGSSEWEQMKRGLSGESLISGMIRIQGKCAAGFDWKLVPTISDSMWCSLGRPRSHQTVSASARKYGKYSQVILCFPFQQSFGTKFQPAVNVAESISPCFRSRSATLCCPSRPPVFTS